MDMNNIDLGNNLEIKSCDASKDNLFSFVSWGPKTRLIKKDAPLDVAYSVRCYVQEKKPFSLQNIYINILVLCGLVVRLDTNAVLNGKKLNIYVRVSSLIRRLEIFHSSTSKESLSEKIKTTYETMDRLGPGIYQIASKTQSIYKARQIILEATKLSPNEISHSKIHHAIIIAKDKTGNLYIGHQGEVIGEGAESTAYEFNVFLSTAKKTNLIYKVTIKLQSLIKKEAIEINWGPDLSKLEESGILPRSQMLWDGMKTVQERMTSQGCFDTDWKPENITYSDRYGIGRIDLDKVNSLKDPVSKWNHAYTPAYMPIEGQKWYETLFLVLRRHENDPSQETKNVLVMAAKTINPEIDTNNLKECKKLLDDEIRKTAQIIQKFQIAKTFTDLFIRPQLETQPELTKKGSGRIEIEEFSDESIGLDEDSLAELKEWYGYPKNPEEELPFARMKRLCESFYADFKKINNQ